MSTDTLHRRLRFAPPSPRVSRMMLTPPDYLMFEAIERHGPLPTGYLYEFTKRQRKNRQHLRHRLTEFYNGDGGGPYLLRPPQQFAGFHARYQDAVYGVAPRAVRLLAERGTLSGHARSGPFLHQLMTACVTASIELSCDAYVCRDEILGARPLALSVGGNTLIPDDLFGLRFPDGWTRYCALEIDRNTESIERRNLSYNTIAKKVRTYCAVLDGRLYQSGWGIANLGVLIVTTNQTHARNILDFIRNEAGRWSERFALQVAKDFGANWRVPQAVLSHVVTAPWLTACGEKFINQQ